MMNQVTIIGRLVRDVELKEGSVSVAKFTVAVNRPKGRNGEDKGTDYIPVVVFGKTAENCAKFTGKGKLVAIQGSFHADNYENKEGKKVYTYEVYGSIVDFLEWGDKKGNEIKVDLSKGFEEINESIPF